MPKMVNLIDWFHTTNQIFRIFKKDCLDYYNKDKRRIFIDRNSKVLLIAHADTVYKAKYLDRYVGKEGGDIVTARGLDDRLGCWIIWKLSHQLKTDLLITDLEEEASSTAFYHKCKKYNWVAEFDRRGDDVVLYNTGSKPFIQALEEFFKIGWGTFSDISFLNTTAAAVNIGIGYYREHSLESWADLIETKRQVDKFKLFYYKYKNTAFVRDPSRCSVYRPYSYIYDGRGTCATSSKRYNYDDYAHCDLCDGLKPIEDLMEKDINSASSLLCLECCAKYGFAFIDSDRIDETAILCSHCGRYIPEDAEICPYCQNFIDLEAIKTEHSWRTDVYKG